MNDPSRYLDEDAEYPVIGNARPRVERLGRRGTILELDEMRIADGECPMRWCGGHLDDGCCDLCGLTVAEYRRRYARLTTVEAKPDYLPTLPQALTLDEYAPADVDEAA